MKKQKKIIKQFQKDYKSLPTGIKPGKSITVPDQNLTIGQLLDRHSRGVSLGAPQLKGEYFDTEVPKFDDLTDALEYKKNLEAKVKEVNAKIKADKAKTKKPSPTNSSIKEKSEVVDSQAEKADSKIKPSK